ncbi:RNA polymerase sigma-70 factor, ECF subfamily [Zhouia amylolytica]|uniref:ECF subfamily RNA polymerase sigma-24 subunit n=2 Tax=Zhouia amylolytica TaxID=376730 RepID=W2UKS0_9FLAO|nr:RNA polymerase sigma-70 factor [Zhouia amylolytica]ETN94046.1 ECF subfamily RNA polymerase sigma-24 subunit [Zhouia amylolytica AD3]MCQ0112942.1 RNA polymerase sigma-70 factor [Zhouia amylolytica]SFS43336.1 RNA polymerase sigma-70 factor, ECF subfamily [Zhouia amylolytica]
MRSLDETKNAVKTDPIKGDTLFDTLYELHASKLFEIIRQYVVSKEDAEELLQDVFLKVWKNKNSLDFTNNVTGYLYRITRNTCLDYLRAKKNRLSVESNTLQQIHLLNYHALSNDTASGIIERELQKQVEKSLEQLPDKCKTVFIKSRFEGKKHKEISEELQIAPKTVENHITKVLKHLRTTLSEYFN